MFYVYKKVLRSISIYMLALTGKTVSSQYIFFLIFLNLCFLIPSPLLSQGYFLKCNFPTVKLSTVATSQVCFIRRARPPAHPSHSVRSCCSLRRLRRPKLIFGKLPLGKLHNLKIAIWEVALGKMPFGKYLRQSKIYIVYKDMLQH